MISAWVLFVDITSSSYKFEQREGSSYESVDPAAWALDPQRHIIVAVFQKASFLSVWLKGTKVKV